MLDTFDKNILAAMQKNANISAAQLGQAIGLSQPACYRRIQRLEEEGYIKRRVALVDPDKIGLGTIVFALVKLTAHGRANLDSFIEAIQAFPNVLECFVILGDQDFFLKVMTKDIYDYERFFFQELSAIEGVTEVKSMVGLSPIKNETALPLPQ